MNLQAFSVNITPYCFLVLVALLTSVNGYALEETGKQNLVVLKNNPFLVPAYVSQPNSSSSLDISQGGLQVRAILLGSSNPTININGLILGLGDEVDGYRLISLDNEKAVLQKNGNEIMLYFENNKNTVDSNL